ncbi:MAG: hypothetical protein Q8O17_03785 [Candidatus Methanoperedens sp.]|nr:hypothetical protein [Candidatus Methanoperedens sp.]
MNSKILLLSIAVISVGLFAMPSTLSLFSGQHTFTNGSDVLCTKCHADVYSELSGATSTAHRTTALKACEGCHQTGTITNVPKGDNTNITFAMDINKSAAHSSVTLECVACHQAVGQNITASAEAHRSFYWNSSYTANASANIMTQNQTSVVLKGANLACIGCHTHATVNVTWRRAIGYNITADAGTTGNWSMTFDVNRSVIGTTYSAGK